MERPREDAAVLDLNGPVRLLRPDGTDISPRLSKARAILLILALSSGHRAARATLRELLWQTRAQEQQAASLRQALSALRRAMGPWREALSDEGTSLRLDTRRVAVRMPERAGRRDMGTDLDTREPAFRAWLDAHRQGGEVLALPVPAPVPVGDMGIVQSLPVVELMTDGEAVSDLVGTEALARASRLLPLRRPLDGEERDLSLLLTAPRVGGAALISARLRDSAGREVDSLLLDPVSSTRGVSRAAERVSAMLLSAPRVGLASVLGCAPATLKEAERRLDLASADAPETMALRAYVRNTALLERMAPDSADALAEARDLSLRALSAAPANPVVLSVAALIALRRGEPGPALDLVQQARRLDPVSAFMQRALAAVAAATGDGRLADRAASAARASSLSRLMPASWTILAAGAAARRGRIGQARDLAQLAHDEDRGYRPPLRFLVVLENSLGRPDRAEAAMHSLRALEPDVTPALMRDRAYPLASLRLAGLIGS